ncbi:MAG: peptidoglycan DD-metalloendopeptidase family protein [Muribaculaceae bacterium]|nr:peptidoglycan DD-metalloendopeptidase family protein [Muribaculaceae bacterium]
MKRFLFFKNIGRLPAMLMALVLVAGLPTFDGGGVVSAQTKTSTAKKKKGNSTVTRKNSPQNQKKGAQTQKKTSATGKKQNNTLPKTRNSKTKNDSASKNNAAQGRRRSTQTQDKQSGVPKSSAEAKKLQEATQREIQQTKEKLRLNEQQIKTGLSDLNRLSSEIAVGKNQVQGLQKKVTALNSEITNLGKEISKNEGELKLMREEYLKAVKKMRLTKKNQSTLAFIFASENFNQAMRRIRYMRQFSAWKERKSADIDAKIDQLGRERESLSKAKDAQTVALGELNKSQALLEANHRKQETLVASLRQNGDVLQAHLVAKQKEANKLKETISSLIAQEQAKAEAERKAREKAEAEKKAKAEAERIAKEKAEAERKAAAEKALAEKAAAEKAAAEKAAEKALAEKIAAEKALAEKSAAERAAAEKEAAEKTRAYKKAAEEKERADRKFAEAKAKAEEKLRKEEDKKKLKNSERSARKKGDRRLKNSVEVREAVKTADPVAATTTRTVEKKVIKETSGNVNFASLRGSLPRPVDGSWRITNPFGRHAMPELPEVEYDNPGIDAEVATGATVKSVCGGKVSGVYKLAGYGNVVIVNHGEYYTVYGNLGSTNVSVGAQVGRGSALGTAGSDPDDPRRGSVHFEVWKGREKQNPSSWLR